MGKPLLPVVVGYGAILLLLVLVSRFRHSWWAAELFRAYEVQRQGPLGRYTARDLWRSAGVSLILAVALLAASLGAFAVMEHFTEATNAGMLANFYFFSLFVLAALAVAVACQTSIRALRVWRLDRRDARERARHPELVAILAAIVRRHDPMRAGELDDREWDYQAGRILLFLPKCQSYEDVCGCLIGSYVAWFGRLGPSVQQDLPRMAQEIWSLWSLRAQSPTVTQNT